MRPVLFVTNHIPPDRAGAFARLHEIVPLELALFGGRSHHATAGLTDPGVPHRRIEQRAALRLAASGRYRAVVCGTAGRVALPAAFVGARLSRTPFVLWSALWAHLATPAHLAARPLMAAVYRGADVVVAYGPHVAAFARAQGAHDVIVAPQAVDNAFWAAPAQPAEPSAAFNAGFAGRDVPEKGRELLLGAWRRSGSGQRDATLTLVGDDSRAAAQTSGAAGPRRGGVTERGALDPEQLRNFYAGLDVLVIPSIPTRGFREPWGLVANEAMNQRVAIIASDAVGAAAGGLVRDGANGIVVAAGDEAALAAALTRLHDDPQLARRMGDQGAVDVTRYTHEAWAQAFADAIAVAEYRDDPC